MHFDKIWIEITNEIWYEYILVSVPCQKPVPCHRPLSIVVCLICYLKWFSSLCALSNNVEGYLNDIICVFFCMRYQSKWLLLDLS